MRLRFLLPPNLAACAPRDAIPTKLEVELSDGSIALPEKLDPESFGELAENERIAAFSIMQWNGGQIASFLQLSSAQLKQLTEGLSSGKSFFWASKPKDPIAWNESALVGVSEHLDSGETAQRSQANTTKQRPADSKTIAYDGAPMTVDGSPHFLAIGLPSREHPHYSEIRELVESEGFKLEPSNRKWWLRDQRKTLNFLSEYWDDLEKRHKATFSDNFASRMKAIDEARIEATVRQDGASYEVQLSVKAGTASESDVRHSLISGKTYIEDGEKIYLLRKDRIESYRNLQQSLSESKDAPLLHKGSYRVSQARATSLDEPISALNPNFKPPSAWRKRCSALRDLESLKPLTLSSELEQTLRPYQKTGAAWLGYLFANELGGILADEMGLGKTLQTLALLSSLAARTGSAKPSLVVCPASLVENWRREAKRFCPQLKVFAHHGKTRMQSSEANAYDLIITSYGTLIRDEALFASLDLFCVIGDEAQHIKNRKTRNAKTLCSLHAKGRFLLTGTPIENSIQDLESLIEFILPGANKPIPKGITSEERHWHEERIKKFAAPYILRRRKRDVATDLPDKIEQVVYIEMSATQRTAYEKARLAAQDEISEMESKGAQEGAIRMKALTQLLRLRQACCDPRLVDKNLRAEDSSKLASLSELLEEAIDGDHRVLVFSQFVSILSLLKNELESLNLPYCYLDGATRNRMAEVDRFNDSSEIPIFLISLKAGGTGLNLTSADTVIHFDPWWNPAAEAQATDRAHRIGQTSIVTSYKLIVTDSVEEKVLQMQDQKRRLLEDVFEASEAANSSIKLEELKALI